MKRRSFLKMALASSAALDTALTAPGVAARGIPAGVFEGRRGGRCYVPPARGLIQTSLAELFKIGPGPSSSHTLAPLRIASDFLQAAEGLPAADIERARSLEVRLFGSLSAAGRGHRTDRAILAGLLGQKPETCDTRLMDALGDPQRSDLTTIGGKVFRVGQDILIWDKTEHDFPFPNTLILRLVGETGEAVLEREYYSTGGGFFQWKGQPAPTRRQPAYPFASMAEFKRVAAESGKAIHEILMENEQALRGVGEQEVLAHLDWVLETMEASVTQGLGEEGLLPAPFELHRKAKRIYERALRANAEEGFLQKISSYAMAGSEGNAAGRLAVTAPTLGSAGTLPALVYLMKQHLQLSQDAMRRGLMAAGLVGLICKQNASIDGADVGCQGEIGVASAMAAAMLAYGTGGSLQTTEIAAAIALEHHLGLSCDPVGGYVLIPCIERNAFGALKAYNAYLLASSEIPSQRWEDLDRVVAAMYETGTALPTPFKEMGTGGLGVTLVDC